MVVDQLFSQVESRYQEWEVALAAEIRQILAEHPDTALLQLHEDSRRLCADAIHGTSFTEPSRILAAILIANISADILTCRQSPLLPISVSRYLR